jgi:hypothetical protein
MKKIIYIISLFSLISYADDVVIGKTMIYYSRQTTDLPELLNYERFESIRQEAEKDLLFSSTGKGAPSEDWEVLGCSPVMQWSGIGLIPATTPGPKTLKSCGRYVTHPEKIKVIVLIGTVSGDPVNGMVQEFTFASDVFHSNLQIRSRHILSNQVTVKLRPEAWGTQIETFTSATNRYWDANTSGQRFSKILDKFTSFYNMTFSFAESAATSLSNKSSPLKKSKDKKAAKVEKDDKPASFFTGIIAELHGGLPDHLAAFSRSYIISDTLSMMEYVVWYSMYYGWMKGDLEGIKTSVNTMKVGKPLGAFTTALMPFRIIAATFNFMQLIEIRRQLYHGDPNDPTVQKLKAAWEVVEKPAEMFFNAQGILLVLSPLIAGFQITPQIYKLFQAYRANRPL